LGPSFQIDGRTPATIISIPRSNVRRQKPGYSPGFLVRFSPDCLRAPVFSSLVSLGGIFSMRRNT
jgi:hypothetical protein